MSESVYVPTRYDGRHARVNRLADGSRGPVGGSRPWQAAHKQHDHETIHARPARLCKEYAPCHLGLAYAVHVALCSSLAKSKGLLRSGADMRGSPLPGSLPRRPRTCMPTAPPY